MIPNEKAKELIAKYFCYAISNYSTAKKCSLVVVNEMIEELEDRKQMVDDNYLFDWNNTVIRFWEEVRQEIENL